MKIDFKSIAKTVANAYNSNKAEIFTGAGIVLMVGATATAVVATVKTMKAASDKKAEKLTEIAVDAESYEQLTEEEQRQYDEIVSNPVPAKELAPIVWKYWMIPILLEVLGAIASIKSNRISAGKITGLAAALGCQIAENNNIKEAVKEVLGEQKTQEIEEKIDQNKADKAENMAVAETNGGTDKFYDYYGGRPFYSSHEYLDRQLNDFNKELNLEAKFRDDGLSLNDWFYKIGLDPIAIGDVLKWNLVGCAKERTELAEFDIKWDQEHKWFVVKFKEGHAPVYNIRMY